MSSLIKNLYFNLCANMPIIKQAENMSEPRQLVFCVFVFFLSFKSSANATVKCRLQLALCFFCIFSPFKSNANATDKCHLSLLACIQFFCIFFHLKVLPMQPINVVFYLTFYTLVTVAPILFILLYCLFCYIMLFQYCKKCGVGQNY